MTADSRFERTLPEILEDLYLGPTPDYRTEALAVAVRTRQRPSWTFAGRWLPMADIASRPAFAPRVPLRTIGMALLLIALIIAAAALAIGSRRTKVPPPFGLAGNGLLAYASEGDIYVLDPATGTSRAITTGPAIDAEPVFSPDGTLVALRRAAGTTAGTPEDIVVVAADGSHPTVVTTAPIPGGPKRLEWAPDSQSILAMEQEDKAIWLFAATAAEAPRTIATNAFAFDRPFQPPDGAAILIGKDTDLGRQVFVLDLVTGKETRVVGGGSGDDIGSARWSPDGTQIVYNDSPPDNATMQRLYIVNANGTGGRQITSAPGTWYDINAAWSPDGSRIAFIRYELVGADWLVRPIGIYSLATGKVTDLGPLPRETRAEAPNEADRFASFGEGYGIEWSPDGQSLIAVPGEATSHPVVMNINDGSYRILSTLVQPSAVAQMWQRRALDR
jgi:Tol biopolymer transport system component